MVYFNEKRELNYQDWLEILGNLGLFDKLYRAHSIVIKPNLAAGTKADPLSHVCTDILFIKNVVELCRSVNPSASIFICEGDSTGDGFAYLKFQHFGLPSTIDPSDELGVKLLDLSRDRLKKIEDKRFLYFGQDNNLWLSKQLCDSDFVISLSNLKTHTITHYTGACKNLFGCLPASVKNVYHPNIHEVVHDLTIAIHPDLNVVDAFYAMGGNGPVGGYDIDGGFRIFSDNAYEADCYGAGLIGMNVSKVKYLKELRWNYGSVNLEKVLIDKYYLNIKYPGTWVIINNCIGLWIQRIGMTISSAGDRIHIAKNPVRAIISLFRPFLIQIFGRDKLKTLKNKMMKR